MVQVLEIRLVHKMAAACSLKREKIGTPMVVQGLLACRVQFEGCIESLLGSRPIALRCQPAPLPHASAQLWRSGAALWWRLYVGDKLPDHFAQALLLIMTLATMQLYEHGMQLHMGLSP